MRMRPHKALVMVGLIGATLTATSAIASAQVGTPASVHESTAQTLMANVSPGSGVYVVRPNADGTVYTAMYTPAAGVSADQLRQVLRNKGVRGVQDAAPAALATAADGRCAPFVGTAAAWCGHKWTYGPFNDPQVY